MQSLVLCVLSCQQVTAHSLCTHWCCAFYLVNRLLRIAYALISAVFYLADRLLHIAYTLIGSVFYLVDRLLRIAYALNGAVCSI